MPRKNGSKIWPSFGVSMAALEPKRSTLLFVKLKLPITSYLDVEEGRIERHPTAKHSWSIFNSCEQLAQNASGGSFMPFCSALYHILELYLVHSWNALS